MLTLVAAFMYSKIIVTDRTYNILLSLVLFILWYGYVKTDVVLDKRKKKYALVLSFIISFLLAVGSIFSSYIYEVAVNVFDVKKIIITIIMTLGLMIFFYRMFGVILKRIDKLDITEKHSNMTKKQIFIVFAIIFGGYLLYFIRFYPAIMTTDSYYVLHYANNFILSDFHPFGHTWFIGIFFHLGKLLFHDMNMALGLAMFVQMLCLSLIFTGAIYYLYNQGLKKILAMILALIYAFDPLHGYYSVTLWRDVLFGGAFVLILISLYDLIKRDGKTSKRYLCLFVIGTLIMLFFRNNGIYIFLVMIPFMIVMLKGKRKTVSILCGSILVFYAIIKGPVFDYFGVSKTTSVEAFSVPLQQLARVIASGREVTGEDLEFLERLFNYDEIASKYRPSISDPVKNLTNNEVLSENMGTFLKTWVHLLMKYPNVYVEAYGLQTLGYWYPDVIYWATAGESEGMFESEPIHSTPLTPSWYNRIVDATASRNIPFCNLIWSVGLPFMLLLVSSFMLWYVRKRKYFLCLIPLYGLWLSIMVATPVFSELRYVYGLFTCVPIFVLLPLLVKKNG